MNYYISEKILEAKEKGSTMLSLELNQLTTLPPEIWQLTNLTELYLWGNQLTTLPPEIGQLTNLTALSLDSNQLTTLPPEIGYLTNLTGLFLGDNHLTTLPPEIGQLSNLTKLHLSNNQLTTLSPEIGKLTNLKILNLGINQLTTLPPEIGQLTNLIWLNLDNNQLTTLPPEIGQLTNLEELILKHNPLLTPPVEIVNKGLKAIRNYFNELMKATEIDYLYEVKLLLVGEGRVGKTSLAKTLSIPNYILEDEQSTEGIDIKPWLIPKAELNLTKDFRINIWDFGGQEIYHATHQFFLTKRSVYLLVTESLKEDRHEDYYYWLNIIKLLGDTSPVIIVLNKCDQPNKDLPINEYRKAFDNIKEFVKISCKEGEKNKRTIDNLKYEIKEIVGNKEFLPHIGSPLPKVWIDIRGELDHLKTTGNNYISYDKYLAICRKYDLNEERALYLSEFFHDIGVILHFQQDIDLRETVILNHEWVTKGVYKVLDSEIAKNKKGKFNDCDLITIWNEDIYKEKRHELLSLMKNQKFELCFDLNNGEYLAPQLLPVDEIAYEWRTEKNNLHFENQYKFMPKGILSRFIVKMNKDIYRETNWRYGVLLEYDNTRAIVKEKYFERKITITLEGNSKKEYLYLIRKAFQDIHRDFHNLEVQEMIPCICSTCKNNNKPHLFNYETLKRFVAKNKETIDCEISTEDVSIEQLLSGIETKESDKEWDFFISHASEDKEQVARPLADALKEKGYQVWLDKDTLTVGDSLRRSIEQGLLKSRFGIVIFSPAFFAKEWPLAELDGLFAIELADNKKVILPVLYNITHDELRRKSLIIASKITVSYSKGLEQVVSEIIKAYNADKRDVG
jgi:small GTP-binding protein